MSNPRGGRLNRYPKHEAALASFLQDIGVHEQPNGSNSGPRIRVYQQATWLGGTGWPWCVAAWLYHTLRGQLVMPYRGAGAYALHDWAHKQGWTVTAANAMVGDAVIFNLGAGHCAMLRAPVTGTIVQTVDGNVSNMVDLRERPLSQVRGFVHVPEKPVPVPPPRKPILFEVVGSVDGQKKVVFTGTRTKLGGWIANTHFHRKYGGITIRRKKKN